MLLMDTWIIRYVYWLGCFVRPFPGGIGTSSYFWGRRNLNIIETVAMGSVHSLLLYTCLVNWAFDFSMMYRRCQESSIRCMSHTIVIVTAAELSVLKPQFIFNHEIKLLIPDDIMKKSLQD